MVELSDEQIEQLRDAGVNIPESNILDVLILSGKETMEVLTILFG